MWPRPSRPPKHWLRSICYQDDGHNLEQTKMLHQTGVAVSDRSYQSTYNKQTFGLGQGSTAASKIWCIMHGILVHTVAIYFGGVILVSVSGIIQHKRVREGLIDDTGLAYSAQSSTEIASTTIKDFSPNESSLFDKMQKMLQFFLELIQVASGDLNISKCDGFTVFHRWCGDRASLLKIKSSHPLMTITHPHTGEIKNIFKKDLGQAHRALGWMMTTDGKSNS
jgi:hypothetical protein